MWFNIDGGWEVYTYDDGDWIDELDGSKIVSEHTVLVAIFEALMEGKSVIAGEN